ncbi:MAG: ATP synthase F1 subunit delta [Myxococcota bacterium]|nr:ATP synthase F1 subunit delta [Myxococcota bacterium]
MAEGSIARRYARALVALGREQDCVDRFGADLAAFLEAIAQADGKLAAALCNPGFTVQERRSVLVPVLAKLDLHPLVGNFLNLLLDKHRFDGISEIEREYQVMADELAGRVKATVTTARPMDPALLAEVTGALSSASGKTVQVTAEVDASLIGGMVAKVGDTVYDSSVRTRLQDVQQRLLGQEPAEA